MVSAFRFEHALELHELVGDLLWIDVVATIGQCLLDLLDTFGVDHGRRDGCRLELAQLTCSI